MMQWAILLSLPARPVSCEHDSKSICLWTGQSDATGATGGSPLGPLGEIAKVYASVPGHTTACTQHPLSLDE